MIKDLTEGKEGRTLLLFVAPMLLSMFFQQMYNVADTLVAGRFLGPDALASVGNSYEITLIFLAIGNGMRMGAGIIIGQMFGRKDREQTKSAITTSYIAIAAVALLLTILGVFLCDILLRAIGTPEHLFALSKEYLDVYIFGLVFLFLYNVTTGIFSALGDTKTPLYFLIFSSLFNIALDVVFVSLLGFGVAGLAWATFICQGICALLSTAILFIRIKGISEGVKAPLFSYPILKRIISVAVPSMCQQSFVSVGNIMIQSIINGFGQAVMAGYAAAIKLNGIAISSIATMGNGVASFAAQNIGAGRFDRVRKARKDAMKIMGIITVSICLFFSLKGDFLLSLFIDKSEQDVIKIGFDFLRIVSPFYAVVMLKSITDAVMRGAGYSKPFMYTTLLDLFLRVVLSFAFSTFLGSVGIWLSWPFGWSAGTILAFYFYRHGKWRKAVDFDSKL